ncbi:sigma-70 family RNA polymerase sigma factor [Nakamurella sp. YIM 132087]|uniref:Sigma-70 family RNA polymerase sigma factor n=1 Tax=Nakamurella alba TaxID=2665158 RepID=A0A7K1FKY0_9ACTN|nr:sigma-70 family RNA polymerase sigma factor [Nakamurella alba]MTD14768.1 sigma-70 family RNA polymerase sigma factor [Nakamurella alba]
MDDLAGLVDRHGLMLLRVAYQLTGDRDSAQDLVQEVLLSMITRTRTGISNPAGYLRRAVVNAHIDRHRLRSSSEVLLAEPEADGGTAAPAAATGGDEFADTVADRDRLWRALGTLDPRSRTVLVLRHYLDLPDDEIAQTLGCSRSTVRSIAARAIHKLRSTAATEPEEADRGRA